jgi:hypothetical protein
MLDKFGDEWRPGNFYAEKYLKAFPTFLSHFSSDYTTPEEWFMRCYNIRTFDRFFIWFGFAIGEEGKNIFEFDNYKKTGLIEKVFSFDKA